MRHLKNAVRQPITELPGENIAARLGRLKGPDDLVGAHTGESGRKGRITSRGIAGISPDMSV